MCIACAQFAQAECNRRRPVAQCTCRARQLLWRGDEALADALALVAVAEAAGARAAERTRGAGVGERAAAAARGGTRGVPDPGDTEQPAEAFVWRQPLTRPAGNEQQVRQPDRV
jgi:hypothetical protein